MFVSFVVFVLPFNVSIRALYVAKNPRYLSIPLQTNKFPVPRKIEQKSQRSPVVFLVSSISVITDPVINSKSLIQIRMYLKHQIVLNQSPGKWFIQHISSFYWAFLNTFHLPQVEKLPHLTKCQIHIQSNQKEPFRFFSQRLGTR